jgi:hypothetical protein
MGVINLFMLESNVNLNAIMTRLTTTYTTISALITNYKTFDASAALSTSLTDPDLFDPSGNQLDFLGTPLTYTDGSVVTDTSSMAFGWMATEQFDSLFLFTGIPKPEIIRSK